MSVIYPANQTWLQTTLDKPMMDYLWSQIESAKGNSKPELVGHITKSAYLPDEENRLANLVRQEAKQIGYIPPKKFSSTRSIWVNWQKKHEFNPLHAHSGSISFVIWMKIPYRHEDEKKRKQAHVNELTLSGCFEFVYISTMGEISKYIYTLGPECEGTLLVFPAALHHQVYPFYTSDQDRISISGNLE